MSWWTWLTNGRKSDCKENSSDGKNKQHPKWRGAGVYLTLNPGVASSQIKGKYAKLQRKPGNVQRNHILPPTYRVKWRGSG